MKKTVCVVKIGNMKDPDPEKRGQVKTILQPDLEVGPTDVKIRVAYCSICGSDPHIAGGIFPQRVVPFGLGHEVSGVIEELGEKATVKGLKVGDRVAGNFLKACGTCYYCNNGQPQFCKNAKDEADSPGMSEYVVWDESQVWKIPDSIGLDEACLLEPVSIAVRISDKAAMKVGSRVAIQGGGPIGLLAMQTLKASGAASLTLIEPIASRRELALQLGAEYVINPSSQDVVSECMNITDGMGYDVIVEASGFAPAAEVPLKIAANGAKLLYVAMFPADYCMPLNLYQNCYQKELTITGTLVAPYAFPRAVQVLPRLYLKPFTEKVFSIDDAEAAFEAHLSGKYPKVLIKCNDL